MTPATLERLVNTGRMLLVYVGAIAILAGLCWLWGEPLTVGGWVGTAIGPAWGIWRTWRRR